MAKLFWAVRARFTDETSFRLVQSLRRPSSVTRWICYSSIFGHLQQRKIAQGNTKFAKVSLKLCKIIRSHIIPKNASFSTKVAKFRQMWSSPLQITQSWTGPNYQHIYLRQNEAFDEFVQNDLALALIHLKVGKRRSSCFQNEISKKNQRVKRLRKNWQSSVEQVFGHRVSIIECPINHVKDLIK